MKNLERNYTVFSESVPGTKEPKELISATKLNKRTFPLQELSQGTKNLLTNSGTKPASQQEETGTKCSSCRTVAGLENVPGSVQEI